jgi:hypothetical protein
MVADGHDPKQRSKQFTLGALFVWMILFSISLTFARYAVQTRGVLSVIALQALGAALGAPFGYLFGEDRIAGAIFGALVGAAIGMLVAVLVMALLVTATVS